jgi:hypothetical protein
MNHFFDRHPGKFIISKRQEVCHTKDWLYRSNPMKYVEAVSGKEGIYEGREASRRRIRPKKGCSLLVMLKKHNIQQTSNRESTIIQSIRVVLTLGNMCN